MKKLLLKSFATGSLFISAATLTAQNDTLLWADFETDPSTYIQMQTMSPGNTTDASWYNFDGDGLADMSGSGRPLEWFWTYGFATVDTANGVLASSSWTLATDPTLDYLITSSIQLIDANAVLSWKSAPYQTPRYMDGYKVVVSTTTNDLNAFTDTIFDAAEYLATNNPSLPNLYSSYDFSAGFVHGADGTYTEFDPGSGDSAALFGVLRPQSVSLAQYAGQTIFILFLHQSVDDNLIAIDDILVMGTDPATVGIKENQAQLAVNLFPNPATDKVSVNVELKNSSDATINIFDLAGKSVYSEKRSKLAQGKNNFSLDLSDLAAGMYQVEITTAEGTAVTKLDVKK